MFLIYRVLLGMPFAGSWRARPSIGLLLLSSLPILFSYLPSTLENLRGWQKSYVSAVPIRKMFSPYWCMVFNRIFLAFLHSFIPKIYIAPLQETCSEALPVQSQLKGVPMPWIESTFRVHFPEAPIECVFFTAHARIYSPESYLTFRLPS